MGPRQELRSFRVRGVSVVRNCGEHMAEWTLTQRNSNKRGLRLYDAASGKFCSENAFLVRGCALWSAAVLWRGRSPALQVVIGRISPTAFLVIAARLDNYAGQFIVNVDVKVVLVRGRKANGQTYAIGLDAVVRRS
jgi:hypothetical protein